MIIDTETVGTFAQPMVHDIGYVIVDKHFNVLVKKRFLVKELHETGKWILNTSDFYCKYSKDYSKARKHERMEKWETIAKEIVSDIKENKATTISAYNIAFDYTAIKYTEEMFGAGKLAKVLDSKGKSLLCIHNLACETILQSPQFRQFADENGLFTEKGNYSTSAETAYKYITNNTEYVECHTALADAEDEKEILEYIIHNVKGNRDMQYGLHYNSWRKAQR